jgi:hypothetical protein
MDTDTPTQPPEQRRSIQADELAWALGLSRAEVNALVDDSRIPATTTPGGEHLFDIDEVRSLLHSA